MKKGFTLIELLIVIVILGMILTIAIPSVANLVQGRGKDSYNIHMKIVEEATKLYTTNNRQSLLGVSSDCIKINYNTIKSVKKIEEKNITCEGNIVLQKTVTKQFTYQYYLDCKDKNGTYYLQKKNDLPASLGCVIFP